MSLHCAMKASADFPFIRFLCVGGWLLKYATKQKLGKNPSPHTHTSFYPYRCWRLRYCFGYDIRHSQMPPFSPPVYWGPVNFKCYSWMFCMTPSVFSVLRFCFQLSMLTRLPAKNNIFWQLDNKLTWIVYA